MKLIFSWTLLFFPSLDTHLLYIFPPLTLSCPIFQFNYFSNISFAQRLVIFLRYTYLLNIFSTFTLSFSFFVLFCFVLFFFFFCNISFACRLLLSVFFLIFCSLVLGFFTLSIFTFPLLSCNFLFLCILLFCNISFV